MIKFEDLEKLEIDREFIEENFFKDDNGYLMTLCFSNKKNIKKKELKKLEEIFKNFDCFSSLNLEPYKVKCGYSEGAGYWIIDYDSDTEKYKNFWLIDINYKKVEKEI